MVPGRTHPSSAEPSPLALASSVLTLALDEVFANIVHNIRRGTSSLPPSGRHGPDPYHLLRLGMGRAQSTTATTPQQRLRPSGGYASEEPGTVATAARRIVATSEGGGRPCRQSRPLRRGFFIANTQHKQSVVSISSRSCCPWRWWTQVTASQRVLARR